MTDKPDKFSTRPGYIPGRCNAYRHTTGHKHKTEGLCKRYPLHGSKRCRYHSAGWKHGKRRSGKQNQSIEEINPQS